MGKRVNLGFVMVESPAQGRIKTYIWTVYSNGGRGTRLGQVKWYSPWRRYCFYPAEDVLLDASCLDELKTWMWRWQ
jgi:hypothetical protein